MHYGAVQICDHSLDHVDIWIHNHFVIALYRPLAYIFISYFCVDNEIGPVAMPVIFD